MPVGQIQNQPTMGDLGAPSQAENEKGILGKDDFLKLLLVELQNQDPTEPMDSDKILTQTSQLATLEASQNTNDALETLAKSLNNQREFSTIAAIGKTADLGSNGITLDDGTTSSFELFFPHDVSQGEVQITDRDGNIVRTLDVGENSRGVYAFDWDGRDNNGASAKEGVYYVSASYLDGESNQRSTRLGAYPIESVRFANGTTELKLGSSYVKLENVKEVY